MTLDPLENKLGRYQPVAPPQGLGDEIIQEVLEKHRGRRTAKGILTFVGILLVVAALVNGQAEREYDDAIRLAGGPAPTVEVDNDGPVMASILSIHFPGAQALLKQNGG